MEEKEVKDRRDYRSHWKVERYNPETYEPIYRAKKAFNTENDAIKEAFRLNSDPKNMSQYVAYKCVTCGKWHIGRSGRSLSKEDKEKYSNKLKKNIKLINKNYIYSNNNDSIIRKSNNKLEIIKIYYIGTAK